MSEEKKQVQICSILDTDLYKLTMQQAVCEQFPRAEAMYQFIDRQKRQYSLEFVKELKQSVAAMRDLRMFDDERVYLKDTCPYLTPVYLDFLRGYQFNPDEVDIELDKEGHLQITVIGPWYKTILWEVPILALVSELYFEMSSSDVKKKKEEIEASDLIKLEMIKALLRAIADFGTRRRYSFKNHNRIIKLFKDVLVGTSNVYLAKKHGLKPIGTQTHEWFMFIGAIFGYKAANRIALEKWAEVYNGDLGIALSDTYGTKAFLQAFDLRLSKLFDGVRHDSGDPLIFADKVIKHYEEHGIDPKSKTIIFSDGLNLSKAREISQHCEGRIKDSYGIGTNLTNDVGVDPLNIVMKLTGASMNGTTWANAIKLSDDTGKYTGNSDDVEIARRVLGV